MAKYVYVTAASDNYIPGLTAQLNSLQAMGNKHNVALLSYRLPEDYLKSLEKYQFKVHVIHSGGDKQVQGTAIERFKIAYKHCCKADAVCMLDADIFFLANCDLFFDIAAKGFIVTGSNGMIINFNTAYQKQYEVDLGVDQFPYTKVHTTAPIWLGRDDLDWFKALYESRRIDHWDDFLYLNLLGIKMGKHKRMITLPPYQFTGIHHWMVKPETSVIKKAGHILAGTEEQVYTVHGKFWDKGWISDFKPTMERYFRDEQIGKKGQQRTWNALQILEDKFKEYLNMRI